jgi:hypothetical protein
VIVQVLNLLIEHDGFAFGLAVFVLVLLWEIPDIVRSFGDAVRRARSRGGEGEES